MTDFPESPMYLLRPHLRPDPARPPFFVGVDESDARIPLDFTTCGARSDHRLFDGVGRLPDDPFVWLEAPLEAHWPQWFGCRIEQRLLGPKAIAPDDRPASFAIATCTACGDRYVLCFSFYERQPGCMTGTLHGAARCARDSDVPIPASDIDPGSCPGV